MLINANKKIYFLSHWAVSRWLLQTVLLLFKLAHNVGRICAGVVFKGHSARTAAE